ncbi:MAG TPA: hypothetical protein VH083_00985 [Myxococcales bacterium]|nr:hypothetical protein [Myxococcales bacterium]
MRVRYELGRALWALRMLAVVLPLLLAALVIGRPARLLWPAGSALALIACGLAFLHARYRRAALLGLAAGLPALLLPSLFAGQICIGGQCFDPCLPSCLLAGALAGGFVAVRGTHEGARFWLSALTMTALLGVLGCSVAGFGGVLGLLAGVAAGALPVLVSRSA